MFTRQVALAFILLVSSTAFSAQSVSALSASAIFAGGCFWCIEKDLEQLPGVSEVTSGYSGGHTVNPTYKEVSRENTGHYEVVKVDYNPAVVSYAELLEVYWRTVDPTDAGGQFCDRGHSYKTAIFANDPSEFATAQASKAALIQAGLKIETPIRMASIFYPAEDYHQDYHKKNPLRYGYYRRACGRNKRVKEVWGDMAYQGLPDKH